LNLNLRLGSKSKIIYETSGKIRFKPHPPQGEAVMPIKFNIVQRGNPTCALAAVPGGEEGAQKGYAASSRVFLEASMRNEWQIFNG
jgi:hypothetical protein